MNLSFERIIQLSSVILIPISIAIAGHLFGLQMKNAEIESQEKRFETTQNFELAKQEVTWRITKSELVYQFMDALTSPDALKRKVAVEALLIALPEDGPRIVQLVAQNDPNEGVQQTANKSIQRQIDRITSEMFSENAAVRKSSTATAISGWQNNPEFIETLIQKAPAHIDNENAIFNAALFLERSNPEHLRKWQKELVDLRSQLEAEGDRNQTLQILKNGVIDEMSQG